MIRDGRKRAPQDEEVRQLYCRRKSRKNDFFLPAGATGLPYMSKPFFWAVSCADGPLATGPPSDAAGARDGFGGIAAVGAAPTAGPGGNSSGPARPQAVSPKAATPSRTSANLALRRSGAKKRSKKRSPNTRKRAPATVQQIAAARFWRQHL